MAVGVGEIGEIVNASSNLPAYVNFTIPVNITDFTFLKTVFFPDVKARFLEMVYLPINNLDALWIVIPLAITLLVMEFYFGRYKNESLGGNTAVGNALVLVYVSASLFRFLYTTQNPASLYEFFAFSIKPWIPLAIVGFGLLLFLINFFHILPEGLSFLISSALPINLTAYIGVVFVYSDIPMDFTSLIAIIGLFVMFGLFFTIIKAFIREAEPEIPPPEEE